jgi:hypothetical protein
MIHPRGPWRSFEAVEYATLEWVDWFKNRRLSEPLGNIPPAEAEAAYHATITPSAMARVSSQMASGKPGRLTRLSLWLYGARGSAEAHAHLQAGI